MAICICLVLTSKYQVLDQVLVLELDLEPISLVFTKDNKQMS